MSINSRQARREAIDKRERYKESYIRKLNYLYNNSVSVDDLPIELPKRYLLRVLREKGAIAYDKETKLFLPFVRKGIDVYGLPTGYDLISYTGYTLSRKPEEVVILRANDEQYPISDYFEIQVDKIIEYDLAIEQNLEACKTMTIAQVRDEKSLLSLTNQIESRRLGATVLFKNSIADQYNDIVVQSTGAQYLVDKLLEARKEVLNETFSTIGLSVANVDKRERVQVAEITASNGYALDSINTLIDTFNHDAELGGLSIRLRGNTSLVIDTDIARQQETEGDNNEQI